MDALWEEQGIDQKKKKCQHMLDSVTDPPGLDMALDPEYRT